MSMFRVSLIALVTFGLDQLSKYIVISSLNLQSVHSIEVWPPYLDFIMAWNTGINFGLFGHYGSRWILVALSVVASAGMFVWAKGKQGWIFPAAAGAVIGGALGNAIDRVHFGAVADFINTSCCGFNNPYSFNLADVFIFCGAIAIAFTHKDAESRD